MPAIGCSLVAMNIARRSAVNCGNGILHTAHSDLDNCFRDYAQQNAKELADLLTGAYADVVLPGSAGSG